MGMGERQTRLASEAATVRIGSVLAVPAVLTSLGVDPARVLAEAGLESTLFDDADNRISFATRSRLIQLCVTRTGCPHFGLLVGEQGGLHSFGLLGLLMKYSPDVATALRGLVHHLHLYVVGGVTTLAVHGDLATLGYQVVLPKSVATDQIGDGAAALMLNMLRSLCGTDWAPTEVWFAHRGPDDIAPYHRVFHAPTRFDAEQYALVFRTADLGRKLPSHDPALHHLLQRQIDVLEASQRDDLPGQVRIVLHTALASGHVSVEQVAAMFSMHSRTLSRRLRALGTSYRELVNEARFEIARQMLEQSAMDLRQLALLLGYADASAFTRAFRRWSGTTPVGWRSRPGPTGS
jgi:AraC-like DNA-binding protein